LAGIAGAKKRKRARRGPESSGRTSEYSDEEQKRPPKMAVMEVSECVCVCVCLSRPAAVGRGTSGSGRRAQASRAFPLRASFPGKLCFPKREFWWGESACAKTASLGIASSFSPTLPLPSKRRRMRAFARTATLFPRPLHSPLLLLSALWSFCPPLSPPQHAALCCLHIPLPNLAPRGPTES
jgi:hypothetical protein